MNAQAQGMANRYHSRDECPLLSANPGVAVNDCDMSSHHVLARALAAAKDEAAQAAAEQEFSRCNELLVRNILIHGR